MSDANLLSQEQELKKQKATWEQRYNKAKAECQALRQQQMELQKQHEEALAKVTRKLESQRQTAEKQRRMSDANLVRKEQELKEQHAKWEQSYRKVRADCQTIKQQQTELEKQYQATRKHESERQPAERSDASSSDPQSQPSTAAQTPLSRDPPSRIRRNTSLLSQLMVCKFVLL